MPSSRLLAVAFAVLAIGACGGKTDEDDDDGDLVIAEAQGSLTGATEAAADDDGPADDGCRDEDRNGHKHHRKHWFRILDLLDGERDKAIVIASLPEGLPDRLLTRLAKIDRDGDGIVTKREVKAARRHRRAARDGD